MQVEEKIIWGERKKNRRISLLYASSVANQNAGFALVH